MNEQLFTEPLFSCEDPTPTRARVVSLIQAEDTFFSSLALTSTLAHTSIFDPQSTLGKGYHYTSAELNLLPLWHILHDASPLSSCLSCCQSWRRE